MRIIIFTTAYLPFIGGAELAVKEITDRIGSSSAPFQRGSTESARGRGSAGGSEGGVSFALITARFKRSVPSHERIGNVDVYRVGLGTPFDKWLLPWLGLRTAKRLNAVEPFDAIWSIMASQASIAATWFKELHQDTPLVLTLQEGDEEAHLRRYVFGSEFLYQLFIRSWHAAVFKQADTITVISNYLAVRAKRNSTAKVVVIPNGVTVGKFEYRISNIEKEEIRKKYGIAKEDKVIITTSRLVEKNGVGDLIEALRYLPDNIKLIICGSGALEKDYKLKARSLQLEHRVHFLGHIPHEQLPDYLHIADVFCRPSLSEGMGSSFVEAMAAGLPVVATPVGGIPDFLFSPSHLFRGGSEGGVLSHEWNEKITGLFCEVENPESIAEKVQLLLTNDELRNRIIANASKMVREKYEWDRIVESMRNVLTN
mgnify:CR=1 FL=1